jgi:hypothetical protein
MAGSPTVRRTRLVRIRCGAGRRRTQSSAEHGQQEETIATDDAPLQTRKVTAIDGMEVAQAIGKPAWIKTCAEWADHLTTTLDSKAKDYDEVHLVFDCYDVSTSPKEATRERRQGGKPATMYHVEDSTPILPIQPANTLVPAPKMS